MSKSQPGSGNLYPSQPGVAPAYPGQYAQPGPQMGPPPPYSVPAQPMPGSGYGAYPSSMPGNAYSAYPGQSAMPPPPPGAQYYAQSYPQQGGYPYGMPPPVYQQAPMNVVVQGAFDADARFDSTSRPVIPPPPPGVAPNAAQLAAMQGHNVTCTKQKRNFFTGSSGGGYVWF